MTTRLQLSAQRFRVRRMMHALVRGDVAMHDDPLRAQSVAIAIGAAVAAIGLVAGAVVTLVAPQGVPESAPIVISRESGALYVRVGDTLHPVLNLASARLVARTAANPVPAGDRAIQESRRGPSMGIPGAPASLGSPAPGASWTVCDDERTVVAVDGSPLEDGPALRPVLVTPRGESAAVTYLLYDGRRAAVDLRNRAVVRALRLNDVLPVPVSRALLDLVPEVPAIAAPPIPGAGEPGPALLGGATVGSVVVVRRASDADYYVVLRDGVQLIGDVAADLIRFTYDRHARPVVAVAPAVIAAAPIAGPLPVGTFPRQAGTPVGLADRLPVCAQWRHRDAAAPTNVVVRAGRSPFDGPTDLVQADGNGPNVDAVVMAGGTSAYVRSASIVGDEAGAGGPRFLVTDAGVVFGVHDDDAATALGLSRPPQPAPWPILAHLPRGPELSIAAASVVRDGLSPPS